MSVYQPKRSAHRSGAVDALTALGKLMGKQRAQRMRFDLMVGPELAMQVQGLSMEPEDVSTAETAQQLLDKLSQAVLTSMFNMTAKLPLEVDNGVRILLDQHSLRVAQVVDQDGYRRLARDGGSYIMAHGRNRV